MKRTSILALLSALALPALGDDLKVTINPHSPTEVAMAAEGFSSVEEWYADLNRNVFVPDAADTLKRTWASLSWETQNSLREAEIKWDKWYNSLPYTTPRHIARRIEVIQQHVGELRAWLPKPAHKESPQPTTDLNAGMLTRGLPPTTGEMGRLV
jgi:hypothetical protein